MSNNMRVYAAVRSEAFVENIREIRKRVAAGVKIMPVIKADAYGHGAVEAAKLLDPYADYYAVAIIEEALSLRESGVIKPIMLLGYTAPENYAAALENDITVTLFTYSAAKKLSEAAQSMGRTGKVHIAVDTGMNRIGFKCTDDSVEEIKKISRLPAVSVEGIFTHFAAADEKNHDFTDMQLKCYLDFLSRLEAAGVNIPLRHGANSAAIMEYPNAGFNMVRPGIILYGLYPSDEVCPQKLPIVPVMELKTIIAYVKDIEKGETVGYGRTFTADRRMRIATIPVGYADGYPRLLSNKGRVIVKGEYAPIVGRICMDQFMVDVSHIENVREGDCVTLIGRDGDCFISAEEIAAHAQTINYEIVCGISKRVPRIYV